MFDSFQIPGQPQDQVMPIIRLARHLLYLRELSVVRETLQTLAEIKMCVCDGGMQTRLTRCFGTVDVSALIVPVSSTG